MSSPEYYARQDSAQTDQNIRNSHIIKHGTQKAIHIDAEEGVANEESALGQGRSTPIVTVRDPLI